MVQYKYCGLIDSLVTVHDSAVVLQNRCGLNFLITSIMVLI